MKKLLSVVAAASLLASVSGHAAEMTPPTVYGALKVSLDLAHNYESGTTDAASKTAEEAKNGMFLNNQTSKLGVKGSHDLGNDLSAVYQMEFAVAGDDNDGTFTGRNTFVGLKGGFGQVIMGKVPTPISGASVAGQFKSTLIADPVLAGGRSINIADNGNAFKSSGPQFRKGNAIRYDAPDLSGVNIAVVLAANEGEAQTSDGKNASSSIADYVDLAVTYGKKSEGIFAGIGYAKNGGKAKGANETTLAVAVQFAQKEGVIAGLDYLTYSDDADGDDAASAAEYRLQVAYKIGALKPKFIYGVTDFKPDTGSFDTTDLAIGLDYALGEGVGTWVEYHTTTNSADIDGFVTADEKESALTVGLAVDF